MEGLEIIGIILIVVGIFGLVYTGLAPKTLQQVDCFDKNDNRIIGQTCEEYQLYGQSPSIYLSLSFLSSILGIALIFIVYSYNMLGWVDF